MADRRRKSGADGVELVVQALLQHATGRYTRVPAGTFRKWVAAGRIPAHGGRRKLFHRDELDAALGHANPAADLRLAIRPVGGEAKRSA
jgi:excisionase family DNA binding protein